jgi:hypothetical protein
MIQIIPEMPKRESFGEKLGRGVGQGVTTLFQQLADVHQQKKSAEYFKNLAEAHPNDRKYQLLADAYNSPLPFEEKRNIAKTLMAGDAYRPEQQERLTKDSISARYGRAIGEIDNSLKNGLYRYGTPEYEQAIEFRKRLAKERDTLLGFAGTEEESLVEDEEIVQPKKKQMPSSKRLPKFDINNPKHRSRRDSVLTKTQGDRKKAGLVLSKEFEL